MSANTAAPPTGGWYHGPISRVDCERLLSFNGLDGCYLVRSSETVKGAYVLSVMQQNRIVHYRIVPDDDSGRLFLQTNRQGATRGFSDLNELIVYYQSAKHGLCSQLLHPIEPAKEEVENDDDTDGEDDDVGDSLGGAEPDNSVVATFLLHWLDRVETEGVGHDYLETVKDYLGSGVMKDIEDIQLSDSPTALKQIFKKKCVELHTQIDSFKSQLDVLQAVFDRASGAKDLCVGAKKPEKRTDYDSLPVRLRECSAAMESLEKTAAVVCRDLAVHVMGTKGIKSRTTSVSTATRSSFLPTTNSTGALPSASSSDSSRDSRLLEGDTHYFEVSMETAGGLQTQKRTLRVNMDEGTLLIMKGVDESTAQVYFQWQLKQLINSRSKERKLGIILEGQGRKDFVFETLKAREHFCQVIQVLKKKHQPQQEQDSITVYTGTFNMGEAAPPPLLDSWLLCQGTGKTLDRADAMAHDIYAIGTQEMRTQINEKDWVAKLKSLLKKLHGTEYEKVSVYTLWSIRLVVLVKAEHSYKISHVQTGYVRTGIGNTLGEQL